jgi:hypothetical protein
MQHTNQANSTDPDASEPFLEPSTGKVSFGVRFLRAAIAGIVSALLYLLFFRESYASVVGDVLLSVIVGQEKYHQLNYELSYEQFHTLVYSINTIVWFLVGALPFLVVKRISSGIWLLIASIIGLVLCGCLIIIVAVSPMFR